MNAKNIIAVCFAVTICVCILVIIIGALCYPPGTVRESTVTGMMDLIKVILGLVGGWLLGRSNEPKEKTP